MTAGGIIVTGVIYGICAAIMAGIGISQLRSGEPVGFFTGREPPKKEHLTDAAAWNRKHGAMWIAYALCFVAAWACGAWLKDRAWAYAALFGGVTLPVIFILLYHRRLSRKYLIRPDGEKEPERTVA